MRGGLSLALVDGAILQYHQYDPGGVSESVDPQIGLLFLDSVARGAPIRFFLQLVSLSTASPISAIDKADTLQANNK